MNRRIKSYPSPSYFYPMHALLTSLKLIKYSLFFCLFSLSGMAEVHQFRGPGGDTSGQFPLDLSRSGIIQWSIDLPGQGLSSPVIAGNNIILTASSGPEEKRLHILCFDQSNGDLKWQRRLMATGRTMCHEKTAVAAPTPVVADQHIFALFSSNDLVCLDFNGNLKWLRGLTVDYPNASNSLGLASSPIFVNGVLVVQIENDSESFAAGIDPLNGKNIWKINRPKAANWTSPIAIPYQNSKVVGLQSSKGMTVVNPLNGQTLWSFGKGASTIPSSTVYKNVLYVPSNGITALNLDSADQSVGDVLWNSRRLRPSTPSPIVTPVGVFTVNNAGVLTCGSLVNGDKIWDLRLKGPFSATPLIFENYLLFVSEKGLVQTVKTFPNEGIITSSLNLQEMILCTPVANKGQVFLRSDSKLWKLSAPLVL